MTSLSTLKPMKISSSSFKTLQKAPEEFIHALNTAARAKGMTEIAKKAGVTRASLYKSLADGGSLRFDTISRVTRALGCKLAVM